VNNEKKNIIQKDEKYSSRASILMDEFTSDIDHKVTLEYVDEIPDLRKKTSWILLRNIFRITIMWQFTRKRRR
jgi:hypothetical protein